MKRLTRILFEQWRGWNKDTPIQIVGVKKAPHIKSSVFNGETWKGYTTSSINSMEGFINLADAKKYFPELDPIKGSKNFTWGMKGMTSTGEPCIRFETHEVEKRMSA